jgi:hypothetical protein
MGDGTYYDRKGKLITQDEWTRLFANKKYQILKQTKVGDRLVSTVWLGMNHNFGWGKKPLIFETLVLDDNYSEDDGTRYSSESAARRGHKKFVKKTLARQSELDRFNYEISKKEENAPTSKRRRGR